jgi:hypothetical protein
MISNSCCAHSQKCSFLAPRHPHRASFKQYSRRSNVRRALQQTEAAATNYISQVQQVSLSKSIRFSSKSTLRTQPCWCLACRIHACTTLAVTGNNPDCANLTITPSCVCSSALCVQAAATYQPVAAQVRQSLLGLWSAAVSPFAVFGDDWLLNALFVLSVALLLYSLLLAAPRQ